MSESNKPLQFIIDKLTESIEEAKTGNRVETKVQAVSKEDFKQVLKKNGWLFNWKKEYKIKDRELYKLVTDQDEDIIHGMISAERRDDHVYMHLIENSPSNLGKNRLYLGVAGNLIAFLCKLSMELGHEGNIAFIAKTQLIEHYQQSLGAFHYSNRLMIIDPIAATRLVSKYYKDE